MLLVGFLKAHTTVPSQKIVLSRTPVQIEVAQQKCFFRKSRGDRRFLPANRAAVLKGGILGQLVIEHLPRPLPAALTGPIATAAERVREAASDCSIYNLSGSFESHLGPRSDTEWKSGFQ